MDTRQPAPAAPLLDVRHLDDIISRQAVEIAGLRRQLAEFESQAHRQVALLESQLMLKEAQYTQQVAALEGQIRTLRETQAQQVGVTDCLETCCVLLIFLFLIGAASVYKIYHQVDKIG